MTTSARYLGALAFVALGGCSAQKEEQAQQGQASPAQFFCRKRSPSYTEIKECFPSLQKCEQTPVGEPLSCFARRTALCAEVLAHLDVGKPEKYNICFASQEECATWCSSKGERPPGDPPRDTGQWCVSIPVCREFRPEEF